MKKKQNKSALHLSKGKEMRGNMNPNFRLKRRKQLTVSDYIKGILAGDRVLLSRAITLIESKNSRHQVMAQQIIEACLPHAGQSLRLGITGTPGVGKSTFIERFGQEMIAQGHQLAVLAIDPTSQLTRGSILGDKTRMQTLSVQKNAFIRPSPAGDSLGGVAQKTRETVILCEAAGFDRIIIETVGVGQSETAVHSMVDFFLLLLLPNAGDELQGIKRGVMEMADMIAINKADGDNVQMAKLAAKQCQNGLHLFPPKASNWVAKARCCSALSGEGLEAIREAVEAYRAQMLDSGYFHRHRANQAQYWMQERIAERLSILFKEDREVKEIYEEVEQRVLNQELSPFKAADLLLQRFRN